jgi:DNA-binding CsgD family transcriptional regulator
MPAKGTKLTIPTMPPYAQGAAEKLRLLGFNGLTFYEFQPLGDVARRIQIRSLDALATPRKIAQYAELLSRKTRMGVAVYTADGWLVDGNTRLQAAYKAGMKHFPAIVLRESWQGAPAALEQRIHAAAATLNLSHGQNLNERDKENAILLIVGEDKDASAEDIARKLGVSRNTVASTLHARAAKDRAGLLGVDMDLTSEFTKSHWRELGSRSKLFTPDVYRELVEFIGEYHVSTGDARVIMNRMQEREYDQERLDVIAAEKESRETTVTSASRRPPLSAMLRQHLGFLLKYAGSEGMLVELGSEKAAQNHDRVIYESIGALKKLAVEQRDMDEKRFAATPGSPRFSG